MDNVDKNEVITDWEYLETDVPLEVCICSYNGSDMTEIAVPSEIEGQTITQVVSDNSIPIFGYCDMNKVIFPKTMQRIEGRIFEGTKLLVELIVEEGNIHYVSKNGVIFTPDEETLVLFPPNRIGSYVLPHKTKRIAKYAFYGSELSALVCSENIELIEEYAFLDSKLMRVDLKKVAFIANNAFVNCSNIIEYVGGKSDKYLFDDGVVYNLSVTELLFFPLNKDIPNGLFLVPETVTRISEFAFSNTKDIAVRLPRGLTTISAFAFQNAQNITVTIYRDVIDFDESAFKNASGTIKTSNETIIKIFETQRLLYGDDSITIIDSTEIEYFDRKLTKAEHKSRMEQAARDFLLNEQNGDTDNIKLKRGIIEAFPWGSRFERIPINIERVATILQDNIYGLEKAKRQLLRWSASYNRIPEVPIRPILFIGPQGCGKTMLGEVFAKSINKPLEFVSIPSIEAGWVLSGSNQTWRDATCGKIIQSIVNFGEYPVFLFDEVDKAGLGGTYSSPQYVLLNLLDQNTRSKFRDAFFDIPVDLSTAFIILTANDKSKIVPFLLDRCYVIEIEPITKHEDKRHILSEYILPRLYKLYKLTADEFYPSDEVNEILIQSKDINNDSVREIERGAEILLQEVVLLLAERENPMQLITSRYVKDILNK